MKKGQLVTILALLTGFLILFDQLVNFERPWQETAIKVSIALIAISIPIAVYALQKRVFPFIPLRYYRILIIMLSILVGTLATALIYVGVSTLQLIPLIILLPISQANIFFLAVLFASCIIVGIIMFALVILSIRSLMSHKPDLAKELAKEIGNK
jgi:hypothetical protein